MCTIVGKTWGLHLDKVVRVDREGNLAMIADSVAYLVGAGKRVVYDAEHFFDGWRDDPDYALACLRAAAERRRRDASSLCDTNGSSLPSQVAGGDGRRGRGAAATRRGSASTATTTPSAAWPTRWPPSRPGARRSRAR